MHKNISVKGEKSAKKIIIVDLIFTFFPILVVFFIRTITTTWENLFIRSDWSFLGLILFGQSLVKLTTILLDNKNRKNNENLLLTFVLLLLFGFFPTAVYLVLIEIQKANTLIFVLQVLWLFLSIISYWVIGVSSIIMSSKKIESDDFIEN